MTSIDPQPNPHATPADAVGEERLVELYGIMARGTGWAAGALEQAGWLDWLAGLPASH